jgi:hypothetical protein
MKVLLIGLLVLGSISSFASNKTCDVLITVNGLGVPVNKMEEILIEKGYNIIYRPSIDHYYSLTYKQSGWIRAEEYGFFDSFTAAEKRIYNVAFKSYNQNSQDKVIFLKQKVFLGLFYDVSDSKINKGLTSHIKRKIKKCKI